MQIQAGSAPTNAKEPITSEETRSLIKVQGNTLAVIEAATVDVARSESEKRALVLQNTTNWLEQLLDEWTVLAQEQEMGQSSDEQGSHRKASKHSSVPAAKTGGTDETAGGPQSTSSEHASTPYVTIGGERTFVGSGRSTSVRKSSAEQNHGENTSTRNHDFLQQPEYSNGRFQRPKVATGESRSPKPWRTPAYASQKSTLDANQTSYVPYQVLEDSSSDDSSEENLSVVAQSGGAYGSRRRKFKGGTPSSIVKAWLAARAKETPSNDEPQTNMYPGIWHDKQSVERSTEQHEVNLLRANLNRLTFPYRIEGPSSRTDCLALTEAIMQQVILKADELQLSEPEARLNRKELINQAESYLSRLETWGSENLR